MGEKKISPLKLTPRNDGEMMELVVMDINRATKTLFHMVNS